MSLANKACFWKYFFTLFGILSSGFVFVLFGGLEPGATGLIASGDYFNPIMFLYLSYIASAIFSFVAERSEEKKALMASAISGFSSMLALRFIKRSWLAIFASALASAMFTAGLLVLFP